MFQEKTPEAPDNPNNATNPHKHIGSVEKGKDPPDPDSTSKQQNPSINLDLGSNIVPRSTKENNEECVNFNEEANETTIRKLPSSTQTSSTNAKSQNKQVNFAPSNLSSI